jgi:hypothetical protein
MRTIGLIGLCAGFTGTIMACSSSSSPVTGTDAGNQHDAAGVDGSHRDTGTTKEGGQPKNDGGGPTGDDSGADAGDDTGGPTGEAGMDAPPPGPEQLLVTFSTYTNMTTTSETVVMNVGTKAIEGKIQFTGGGITDARNASSLFLLEQGLDVVAKLDATKPWMVDSTWNVLGTDGPDAGPIQYAADPVGVVVDSGTVAYILRQNRNNIDVINESMNADGGVPSSTVSLAGLLQTGDSDGVVEMTAGVYVASSKRLYVVLGNVDQNVAATYGNNVICSSSLTSTLTAIDTTNNTIVSLGGSGPKGSIPLTYYDPTNMVYDATGGRLIIVSSGCYAKPATPTTPVGAITERGIEAVDLATEKSSSLLPLTATTFPAPFVDLVTSFAYIDSTHAVLSFDSSEVYAWDPTKTTVGSVIANAPGVFAYDGNGHLLGTSPPSTAVISVPIAGGTVTTLGTTVTSLGGTPYVSSVDVWPHP